MTKHKDIVERLRTVRGYRVCECKIDEPVNPDGPEAAALLERYREALLEIAYAISGENYDSDRDWALAMQRRAKEAVQLTPTDGADNG